MARNFVQRGDTVTMASPVGGCKSGDLLHIGSLFGVAAFDAAEAADVEMHVVGIWELPKDGNSVTQGAAVYWTGSEVTATSSSEHALVGAAIETVGGSATTVRVRLNGIAL